ncbi:MAG: translation elongation factor Ts [Lachnospiraceae bacterium]|nr:translation elongation factor Ts [Lachnospiraceae bacterium]
MAEITAKMVKELREMTGAGMMDCKKALTESEGNMDEAVEILKKSGAAKMEKKASRIAAEGLCRISGDSKKAVVVEVNSETDFVAKNEIFQEFVQKVADTALQSGLKGGKNGEDVEELLEKHGIKEQLIEKTATIGEKLSVRRFERIEADCVSSYIHGGGKIGVLVAATGADDDAVKTALKDIAMQVAAMSPQYVSREDIPDEEMAKIREITIDSALNDPPTLPKPILQKIIDEAVNEKKWNEEDIAIYEEKKSNMNFLFNFLSEEAKNVCAGIGLSHKPEYLGDKIFNGLVEGRVSKHVKDISLMDQVFVKAEDGKQNVKQYLASVNKDLKILSFIRFETGEGIEKKEEDYAAEVAKQVAAAKGQ